MSTTENTPLPADHPAIVHALKQGHENGWNAAGSALRDMADELERSRAECRHLNARLDEAGEKIAELNRAGLATTDAEAAWIEWVKDIPGDPEDYADISGVFKAGYRAGLAHKAGEDA